MHQRLKINKVSKIKRSYLSPRRWLGWNGSAQESAYVAGQGVEAFSSKKSLTRSALEGKARAGRGLNIAGKGRAQAVAGQSVDWLQTLVRKGSGVLQLEHLQYRQPPAGTSVLHMVLLDMSASMLKANKLARAKGYLQALGQQAYQSRDRIGVIGFGGQGAQWLQHPSKARACNDVWLEPLGGGGGTPLEGALKLLAPWLDKREQKVCVSLLSDGRFEHLPEKPRGLNECVIVDFESDGLALQRCKTLADKWGADCVRAVPSEFV